MGMTNKPDLSRLPEPYIWTGILLALALAAFLVGIVVGVVR